MSTPTKVRLVRLVLLVLLNIAACGAFTWTEPMCRVPECAREAGADR